MERSRRWFVSALLAVGTSGASGLTRACGFDGIFDAGFGTIHPRAIEVALAVRRAVADGLLPQSALAPLTPGEAGLWHATEMLRHLGRRLSTGRATGLQSPDVALLCADASLWARYVANARSFDTLVHVDKPAPLDAIVITDLAVVAALTQGRLPAQTAITRGVLLIEASEQDVGAVTALLAVACHEPASAAMDVSSKTPWGPRSVRW
jgi:hypothetical protein